MTTQIKDSQSITDTYGDHDSISIDDTVDTTAAERPNGAADPTTQRLQDPRAQLAREGVDISLRSLQVWADLARQRGLTARGYCATATYDLFEKLLMAQRQVLNELVAAQRQLAQECLASTPTVGDGTALR
jgi:hypothetical protein